MPESSAGCCAQLTVGGRRLLQPRERDLGTGWSHPSQPAGVHSFGLVWFCFMVGLDNQHYKREGVKNLFMESICNEGPPSSRLRIEVEFFFATNAVFTFIVRMEEQISGSNAMKKL